MFFEIAYALDDHYELLIVILTVFTLVEFNWIKKDANEIKTSYSRMERNSTGPV